MAVAPTADRITAPGSPQALAHQAEAAEIEAFYREFFLPLVRRAIRRHGLSNEDARDVVQEAFVIALTKMESDGNAGAWLKQVVDFVSINLKRTALRRADLLSRWTSGEQCDPRERNAISEET